MMKPKDIFQLALKILGLVFLYHGLMLAPTIIPLVFSKDMSTSFFGTISIVWPLWLAHWLLGGAPFLMDIAYPPAPGSAPETKLPGDAEVGAKSDTRV